MFRLQAIQIYLLEENDSPEKIKLKLKLHDLLRAKFCICYAVFLVLEGFLSSHPNFFAEAKSDIRYAYFNMVVRSLSFCVFLATELYMMKMIFGLQKLWRNYFQMKRTYYIEIFFVVMYFIFFITYGHVNRLIIEPIILI